MGMKEQAAAATQWMIERIESAIESGEKLTWASGCESGLPRNFTTGKDYRGWNIFRCWMTEFKRQLWAGAGQIKKAGGRVRREEWARPTWILLWQPRETKPDDDGNVKRYWYSKALKVWNIDQCEGLPDDVVVEPSGAEEVPDIDAFFDGVLDAEGIRLDESSMYPTGCYMYEVDRIGLPLREAYHGSAARHGHLAHELVHATGHAKRLNRDCFGIGMDGYSREELVAEFGAAIIGAILGFDGGKEVENHAAYLRGWLRSLENDPTLLGTAASAAQKAVDRIMEKGRAKLPAAVETEAASA